VELYGVLEGADAAPTVAAVAAVGQLERALGERLTRWHALEGRFHSVTRGVQ
jgi:hypothetical protein